MDIDKLKPWNWFKHENSESYQIPVSKNEASTVSSSDEKGLTSKQNQAAGSLMKLHHEMDRLFDDVWRSFGTPTTFSLKRPTSALNNSLFENSMLGDYQARLDVAGSDKEYEVSIDLPGLSEDDIQIDRNGSVLTIKGQKEEKNETKDKHYYRIERSVGSFQRTLSLPEDASRDEISANMKNGLLVIKIPRTALPSNDVKHISISS